MNSFRVTLFLQHFFSDQRASCRVYITSQMKTIQDLQNHINDIFHLDKDFYLISNNLFLPNAEDVRILKEDDIVIAVPCNLMQLQPCNDRIEVEEVSEPKKVLKNSGRKRKRSVSAINDNGSEKEKSCKEKSEDKLCVNVELVNVEEKKKCNEEDKQKKRKKSKFEDIENINAELTNCDKKKKKKKEKVNKNLSNDENHIKNVHDNNDKKEKIKVDDSFINALTVDFKENNNNLSKTIPSSTPLKLSKPKEIKLMKISTIPKVIKTILVYDRKPIANNIIGNELSRSKECEKEGETMVPTAANPDEATKLIDDDALVEYPEKASVNNSFITLKSFVDSSGNNDLTPESTMTNSVNNKKTNGFTVDEKCNKSRTEVPLLNDEKYEQELKKTNLANDADLISTKNDEVQLKEITENRKVHVLDNVCVQPAVTDQDSTKNPVMSAEEFSESITSITADEASLEMPKPKRKRKRTRKKKVKESIQKGVFETPVFTKPNNIPKPTNKHIKFDDDNKNVILEDQQTQQFQSDVDPTRNDQSNQQKVEVNVLNIVNVASSFSYEKLCNEVIMKYPVMVDIYPKTDDIIAFKIYILSENYTPEISDFIIAKVVNYDTENKIVFLRFLGGEQCTEPEGKFYVEEVLSQPSSGERYFSWEALKEPRLLFP